MHVQVHAVAGELCSVIYPAALLHAYKHGSCESASLAFAEEFLTNQTKEENKIPTQRFRGIEEVHFLGYDLRLRILQTHRKRAFGDNASNRPR